MLRALLALACALLCATLLGLLVALGSLRSRMPDDD
jgi:hypothetical protein